MVYSFILKGLIMVYLILDIFIGIFGLVSGRVVKVKIESIGFMLSYTYYECQHINGKTRIAHN